MENRLVSASKNAPESNRQQADRKTERQREEDKRVDGGPFAASPTARHPWRLKSRPTQPPPASLLMVPGPPEAQRPILFRLLHSWAPMSWQIGLLSKAEKVNPVYKEREHKIRVGQCDSNAKL